MESKHRKIRIICIVLLCSLFLGSLFLGRYVLSFEDIIDVFLGHSNMGASVLLKIRLPRILLVVLCGAALSLAGYVLQSLFQNPLVSGDVLGVSQGCGVGAVSAMLLGCSLWEVQLFSFVSGVITVLLCMRMASMWKGTSILHLILSGIIIGALANAFIMILKLGADPLKDLPSIEFWMMGSFSSAGYGEFISVLFLVSGASLLLYHLRYQIFVLSHGDEEAKTLGIDVNKVRWIALMASTLLISAVISVSGIISWIGLIAPHIVRLLVKRPIHFSMLDAMLCGSILLLLADTVARTLWSFEMPISILTSIMGALFLWYLLVKRGIRL